MNEASQFLAWSIVSIVFVDILYLLEYLPGGTISQGVTEIAEHWPLSSRAAYVVIAIVGYQHFFDWKLR